MKKAFLFFLFCALLSAGCNNNNKIDITPHQVDENADIFFQHAVVLIDAYFDVDSTKKAIELLDKAISIDEMNPDYYGTKAKLLAEMGLLDSALNVQSHANSIDAINGEYLLQLGLFQAAKGYSEQSVVSFKRSNDYLNQVLKVYPDSLGAFINQQAANALYYGNDSLFMDDLKAIRKRFPDHLIEIEMARRLKPQKLIQQIKKIEMDAINDMISEIDREMFNND